MTTSAYAPRRGFTLIEVLIVIVVIAILALVIIPRVMGASRKSMESTLKANLHEIRTALEQFQADTGGYPQADHLADLVSTTGAPAGTTLVDQSGTTLSYIAGTYRGPYLTTQGGIDNSGIPANPFVSANTGNIANDISASWTYVAAAGTTNSGIVHSAFAGTTLGDNVAYTSL